MSSPKEVWSKEVPQATPETKGSDTNSLVPDTKGHPQGSCFHAYWFWPDQTCSFMSHGCSREFWAQDNTLSFLSHFSGHAWAVFAVWERALPCWEGHCLWGCPCYDGVLHCLQQCLSGWFVSTATHMGTQGFPAENLIATKWLMLFT